MLEGEQSSFETGTSATLGWRAPEQIAGGRCSRSVDLFSLGCLIYYVVTWGAHPFGPRAAREVNILAGRADSSRLADQPEARSLISRLLSTVPADRPSIAYTRAHPFFWSWPRSPSLPTGRPSMPTPVPTDCLLSHPPLLRSASTSHFGGVGCGRCSCC